MQQVTVPEVHSMPSADNADRETIMQRLSRKDYLQQSFAAGMGLVGVLALGGALPARAATVATTRSAASVGTLVNIPQTLNNCGPASIAEVLAYWGIYRTQSAVQAVLRVNGAVQGMTPYGVPSYASSLGMGAVVGFAGSTALVKALIRNGYPVIVCQSVSMTDQSSHYRPISAYDDGQGVFISSDPYLGPNHVIGYADFAQMWAPDDNPFIVLYPASRQSDVSAILASAGWNKTQAYTYDLAWVKARLTSTTLQDPNWAPPLAVPGERYLRLAWDETQLGHSAAARQALAQAAAQGSTPTTLSWISGALTGLA